MVGYADGREPAFPRLCDVLGRSASGVAAALGVGVVVGQRRYGIGVEDLGTLFCGGDLMGALATLNFMDLAESDRIEWVLGQTDGRGADVTIECTGVPRQARRPCASPVTPVVS